MGETITTRAIFHGKRSTTWVFLTYQIRRYHARERARARLREVERALTAPRRPWWRLWRRDGG